MLYLFGLHLFVLHKYVINKLYKKFNLEVLKMVPIFMALHFMIPTHLAFWVRSGFFNWSPREYSQ